jgi:hypothetical protein
MEGRLPGGDAVSTCNKWYNPSMVSDELGPASPQTDDGVRRVEHALIRAQQLVDRKPTGPADLSWHIEATQVGDLSVLALLLRREPPTGPSPSASAIA